MQDKHKFSIEISDETWTELGVIACRKKSNRSKIASDILDEYVKKMLEKEIKTKL